MIDSSIVALAVAAALIFVGLIGCLFIWAVGNISKIEDMQDE